MNCGGFTTNHYKECIQLAQDKGYTIIPIREYKDNKAKVKKVILLRHDIDFSLQNAYELANIEYDLGVRSSYYLYLHSELYNALSPKSMEMLRQMVGMRHEIGLHYDSRYLLHCEGMIMHDLVSQKEMTYSQHWPASNTRLKGDVSELDMKYISDSGRNWREGCLCSHIGKEDKLHVSMHPEWYINEGADRWQAINNIYQSYESTLSRNMTDVRNMLVDYEKEVINK